MIEKFKIQSLKFKVNAARGQVALAFVLLVGGVTIVIVLALAIIVISLITSSFGAQAASRVFAIASAGAYDGIMRVVRDKDFNAPGGYSVSLGADTATTTISRDSPTVGQTTIVADSRFRGYRSKVQVVLSVVSNTGQVEVISFRPVNQ